METQSAKFSSADEWSRILPPLIKTIFRRQSCFLCLYSAFVTLQYLHDPMAWERASATMSIIAYCNSVDLEESMRWRMQMGKAFCCFSLGSSFLYNHSCHCRSQLTLHSESLWGFTCPFPLKAAATSLMVFENVFLAREPSPCCENCP